MKVDQVVERFLLSGSAFVPYNRDGVGDQLVVLMANGEKESISMRAQTFLQHLVRSYGSDLTALREIYGRAIGRKYFIPLPLAPQFTLVPFKVRKPIGRQGTQGWIVSERIQGLRRQTDNSSKLFLAGQHKVNVRQSLDSCQQQLRHVLLVQHHYHQLQQRVRESYFRYHYQPMPRDDGSELY